MDLETRQAYSEVDKFLGLLGIEMVNKIPIKLREFFKREMDKSYNPKIDINVPIKEQHLKRKTIAIIAGLNLQYWCEEERKKELSKIYSDNEEKYQEELYERYNPDNVFKNSLKITNENISIDNELVEIKELKWYQKILEKIMSLFRKK